jgi:hypothetical protein
MVTVVELIVGVALIYGVGIVTGWHLARRLTGYMLGGRGHGA